ncbi:universal stress protein [Thermococcus sp. M39]|uniref:universal stress protein n=1 Tax=unclassified Thermococcus TaxID=2627626 RepID=UPI00143B0C28|nr:MULTISPECIES: universal stress protein [unclassified Thermococcus]NJE09051.1 universal stress protein [Thermococcus sp. M39]NJE13284.1 universal stress protein [Thermococcus sp. LS2]
MELFSSLIQRKFKNIAEKRYERILREYKEFLLTEEEMVLPEIKSILMPLDRFISEVPTGVYDTLSAYKEAKILLVYIIDAQVFHMIEQTLGRRASEEFRKKEESYGKALLEKIAGNFEELSISTQLRLFFGDKSEDVIKLAEKHDMLVLSKAYGSEITKTHPLSPVVLKIVQHVGIPVIIY